MDGWTGGADVPDAALKPQVPGQWHTSSRAGSIHGVMGSDSGKTLLGHHQLSFPSGLQTSHSSNFFTFKTGVNPSTLWIVKMEGKA